MTYSRAKVQGQQSVGSKDRVETHRQTDRGDCIISLANVVGNKILLHFQSNGIHDEGQLCTVGFE